MAIKHTSDGKKGGLLKGKPHYDENGKPMGGIKAVVTDTGQQVELEGGEVIINKEASKKHWKQLSKINQSAGGGVPILPPDGTEEDVDENSLGKGGRVIEFKRNHLPRGFIYNYAKKIKDKYPKVWDMGGNIFGNEAFTNLERAYKRGYWMESEAWMYKKWQAFNARHSGDIRIAGIIANLKWLNVVDKGWTYMKNLIEDEIDKKYPDKKAKGGVITYKDKYNKKFGYEKGESHTLSEVAKDTGKSKKGLQQIYNKGIGAYKTNPESVRPQVKSKEQWAMARVYSAVMGGKAAKVDAKELKMDKGGELKKGIKVEREHIATARKLYNRQITPDEAAQSVAREHLKEDPKYYSKLLAMEAKMARGGVTSTPVKFQIPTITGKPSKLSYIQQVLVRTVAFKAWFGDWETAAKKWAAETVRNNETWQKTWDGVSKLMDAETLEPKMVFHGTRSEDEFYTFRTHVGHGGRPYAYFAYNRPYSELFAMSMRNKERNWSGLYDVFLSIKEPFMMIGKNYTDKRYGWEEWVFHFAQVIIQDKVLRGEIQEPDSDLKKEFFVQFATDIAQYAAAVGAANGGKPFTFWKFMSRDVNGVFKQFLQKHGYDSIIYTEECCEDYNPDNPAEFTMAATIFNPNQVKLADGRNATFDSSVDDIRLEDGGTIQNYNLTELLNKYSAHSEKSMGEEIAPREKSDREYLTNLFSKIKR